MYILSPSQHSSRNILKNNSKQKRVMRMFTTLLLFRVTESWERPKCSKMGDWLNTDGRL